MTNTVYIIGAPGSGKTTALQSALQTLGLPHPTQRNEPIPHLTYGHAVAQPGRDRGAFSGTDALAMGINPKACQWLASQPAPTVIGEGDRLANKRFFATAQQVGTLTVVWLDVSSSVARARCSRRATLHNTKPQDPAWWKSRETKVKRIASSTANVTRIEADQTAAQVANQLAELLAEKCDI